jgi:hypothetical protein
MPGFLRAATIVLGSSAVLGAGLLALLPSPPEGTRPVRAVVGGGVSISELPKASCRQQQSQVCQSWTVVAETTPAKPASKTSGAGGAMQKMQTSSSQIAAQPVSAEQQMDGLSSEAIDPYIVVGETAADMQSRAWLVAQDEKNKPAARGRGVHHAMTVTAHAADGSRRVIVIRPQSKQDHFYYTTHRDVAATTFWALRQ